MGLIHRCYDSGICKIRNEFTYFLNVLRYHKYHLVSKYRHIISRQQPKYKGGSSTTSYTHPRTWVAEYFKEKKEAENERGLSKFSV